MMHTPNTDETPNPLLTLGSPPRPLRIFANRNLRLDSIKAIGFDMDYTLARYQRETIEKLAHTLTIDKLLAKGYPAAIKRFKYNPHFIIRGLTIDKQLGNILKLNRHGYVSRAMHGYRVLSGKEKQALYGQEKIYFGPPRFALIDTLFSLPEGCLYASLVDFFDKLPKTTSHPSYAELFEDTRNCINDAHQDGSLKSIIQDNLAKYIIKDPLLAKTLHKLRSAGKKLFLLTNSQFPYTDKLMNYLLDGELAEYPSWRHYFEVIITDAEKPKFFLNHKPLNLEPTTAKEKNPTYYGGSLPALEALLGFSNDQILYIGDHIYADILSSKKTSLWRTALIIEELEDEIKHTLRFAGEIDYLKQLESTRLELDELANIERLQLRAYEKEPATDPAIYQALSLKREKTRQLLKSTTQELNRIERLIEDTFNKNWGLICKGSGETTRFGEQVSDYACIYTSRVSNFIYYSCFQYFRSPRAFMPHEISST